MMLTVSYTQFLRSREREPVEAVWQACQSDDQVLHAMTKLQENPFLKFGPSPCQQKTIIYSI